MKTYLENNECSKYLPIGRRFFSKTESQRLRAKLPSLTRWFSIDNFYIRVMSSIYGDSILITGSGLLGQILLLSQNNSEYWIYNYDTNKLKFFAKSTFGSSVISPLFNSGVHTVTPDGFDFFDTKKKTPLLQSVYADDADVANDIITETQYVVSPTRIMLQKATTVLLTAINFTGFALQRAWNTIKPLCYGSLLRFFSWEDNAWNMAGGVEIWQYSTSSAPRRLQTWKPRIFSPSPATGLIAFQFYYGNVSNNIGPLDDIRVTFGTTMRRGTITGLPLDGYCEVLTYTKTMTFADLPSQEEYLAKIYFFIGTSFPPDDGNPNIYTESLGVVDLKYGNTDWGSVSFQPLIELDFSAFHKGYTADPGANLEFKERTLNIDMWQGEIVPPDEDDLEQTVTCLCGCLISGEGGKFLLFRFNEFGGVKAVVSGEDYIEHSVSANGQIVAILRGATREEATIEAWNIGKGDHGTKLGGLPTLPMGKVDSIAYIPLRAINFEEAILGTTINFELDTLGSSKYEPAMSGFRQPLYSHGALGLNAWWKVLIDEGIYAKGLLYDDPCWEIVLTILYPVDFTSACSISVDGIIYNASSWGSLTEILPYKLYAFSDPANNRGEACLVKFDLDGKPLQVTISGSSNVLHGPYERGNISVNRVNDAGAPEVFWYEPGENAIPNYSWSSSQGTLSKYPDGGTITGTTRQVKLELSAEEREAAGACIGDEEDFPKYTDVTVSLGDGCGKSDSTTDAIKVLKIDTSGSTVVGPIDDVLNSGYGYPFNPSTHAQDFTEVRVTTDGVAGSWVPYSDYVFPSCGVISVDFRDACGNIIYGDDYKVNNGHYVMTACTFYGIPSYGDPPPPPCCPAETSETLITDISDYDSNHPSITYTKDEYMQCCTSDDIWNLSGKVWCDDGMGGFVEVSCGTTYDTDCDTGCGAGQSVGSVPSGLVNSLGNPGSYLTSCADGSHNVKSVIMHNATYRWECV